MNGDAPLYEVKDGREDKRQTDRYQDLQRNPATRDVGNHGVLQNESVINAIFDNLATQSHPHLVLYFHGGLVGAQQAKVAVEEFNACLGHHGLTPLSWVWNSDAWTEIRDDLAALWGNGPSDETSRWKRIAARAAKFWWRVPTPFWRRTWRRWRGGSSHGYLATLLEEFGRGASEGVLLTHLWNLMKVDICEAFNAEGERRAGVHFLKRLRNYVASPPAGQTPLKVSLIGHSAGALYICELLRACAAMDFDFQFETVIFWAPGVNFPTFNDTIVRYSTLYKQFHQFGLQDKYEQQDTLSLPTDKKGPYLIFYPHSLLYLVAGLLDRESGVSPLVGMQRYVNPAPSHRLFNDAPYQRVRAFLNDPTQPRVTWSDTMKTHGGFIKDTQAGGVVPTTLKLLTGDATSVSPE